MLEILLKENKDKKAWTLSVKVQKILGEFNSRLTTPPHIKKWENSQESKSLGLRLS